MSLTGNLAEFSLPEVLQFLSHGHHTGILTVASRLDSEHGAALPTSAKIHFLEGKIAFASAGYRQRLGHRLISKGLLSPQALRSLLDKQRLTIARKSVGAILVEEELLCHNALKQEVRGQVLQIVSAIVGWRNGVFRFDAVNLHAEDYPGADQGLTVEFVLLEILRRRDEEIIGAAAAVC
jgi:hypothetical protein